MMSDDPRSIQQPKRIPKRVREAFLAETGGIKLAVTVSDNNGIVRYGFAYGGAPVPMRHQQGEFFATAGVEKLLEWVMEGEADGYMKVTVTRDEATLYERAKSTIPKPKKTSYDAFKIKVT